MILVIIEIRLETPKLGTIVLGRKNFKPLFDRRKKARLKGRSVVQIFWFSRSHLFSLNESLLYVISTRNNCCKFLTSHGVHLQSVQ